MTAAATPPTPGHGHTSDPTGDATVGVDQAGRPCLIPLTRDEIRRLFATAFGTVRSLHHRLHWSRWRRHHQAVARACHYRRRAAQAA